MLKKVLVFGAAGIGAGVAREFIPRILPPNVATFGNGVLVKWGTPVVGGTIFGVLASMIVKP